MLSFENAEVGVSRIFFRGPLKSPTIQATTGKDTPPLQLMFHWQELFGVPAGCEGELESACLPKMEMKFLADETI